MFCSACGVRLPDGSRFCFNCGARLGESTFTFAPEVPSGKLVAAKCTSCGSSLEVDREQKAAVCPYCGSAYIVDEAIQNYNINVRGNVTVNGATININGVNIENLLERAEQYAFEGNFELAEDYFNQVLDSEISNLKAQKGIARINDIINSYSYKTEVTSIGKLELKKERLILNNGADPQLFELKRVFELNITKKSFFSSDKVLQFLYNGIPQRRYTLDVKDVNGWYMAIEDAKMGKYPAMKNLGELYKNRL
ncbi:MAG: zinc ribbon domain-containing protein [Eubacterium sp.]|nr:zinc ribbon domain-containing protein [Eubacterium sp.]